MEGMLQGLPAGVHGIHIHETGLCAAPDFKTAGGHFNPSAKQHGEMNPLGAHLGDMGNITAPAQGSVTVRTFAKGATIARGPNSLLQAQGTAIVIHASADDRRSDPAGNSGERIACGSISR